MSPRTVEQNAEIRKESRQKIMEAAFELIAKNGYEATSIAMIAQKAGVSKGLLYNYFTSKEELLKELVNSIIDIGEEQMADLLHGEPKEALRRLFTLFFYEIREKQDHWRLLTELTMKIEKFDFVHEIVVTKMTEYIKILESLMAKLGYSDPLGEARLVTALFDGIGVQALMIREEYPLDELEKFLIDKYCK